MKQFTSRQFLVFAALVACATIILVYKNGFMELVRAIPGDRLRELSEYEGRPGPGVVAVLRAAGPGAGPYRDIAPGTADG